MKFSSIAPLACLAMLILGGCQGLGSDDRGQSWGKPVVVLASVSEANGAERDITPLVPFAVPEYPTGLLQAGFEGYVDVGVKLKEDGSVKDAMILKSTMKDFESNVVPLVKTWHFAPLKKEPKPPGTVREDIDLVCRIRYSIEQYWHDYGSGDSSGKPSKRSGEMSGSAPTTERSHEMKGP
jgi:TonB family protein